MALLLVGCGGQGYETVDAVTAAPEDFEGETVRVRGWSGFLRSTTLRACVPVTCDCNHGEGHLILRGDAESAGARLGVPSVTGEGNDCTLAMTVFDPSAPAYELVGRVEIEQAGMFAPVNVMLVDLDLDASRALYGDGELADLTPEPLALGDHSCSCEDGFLETCGDAGKPLTCVP